MTIEKATIRRVWEPARPSTHFTVIVQPRGQFQELTLWTRDAWLASLADRYANPAGRPQVAVLYDEQTRELTSVGLGVAA